MTSKRPAIRKHDARKRPATQAPGAPHWNAFDAWCMVGRHLKQRLGQPHSVRDLLADMDRCGIAEAMVIDCLSRENHGLEGNARALDAVARSPRLHAAWSLLPSGTLDEQPPPADIVRQMRRCKVAAGVLLPNQYRFNLADWCIDELAEALAAAGVPVLVNYNEIGPGPLGTDTTNLTEVVAFCRRWPKLPVIVSEFRIRRSQRLIYRALDACDNLHVELSGYWLHRGVEYVTQRWGSRRLVFGTNWPLLGQGPTLARLAMAEISDADKRAVAGGNFRRMIRWCRPSHPSYRPPPPADEFVAAARAGTPAKGFEIWDCHGHIGGRAAHYHIPDGDLGATIRELDRHCVAKACVFSFAGVFSDETYGNDIVADAVRRHPDRLVGFTLLNPHRGRDAMLRELDRCAGLGLRGIKLIPYYQGYAEDGELLDVPCRWAHQRKQVILNHNWGSPAHIERLTSQYPGALFINGHTNMTYADVVRRRDNLYICTCPLCGPRDCEDAVRQIGADKLLFGSDLQDLPIAWGAGPIQLATIPLADKRLILGENLKAILTRYSLRA